MLVEKVLSAFLTDSGLDFELFEKLLDDSEVIKDEVLNLSSSNLNLLLKILIDSKQASTLSKVLGLLESQNADFDHAIVVLGLIKLDVLNSIEDAQKNNNLLQGLNKKTAFHLKPYLDLFPDRYKQTIEASVSLQRESVETFRNELKDQIEFLKAEELVKKAVEIEQKLKFHFPDIKEVFISEKQAEVKSQEHKFSKVIERNLSFEARSHKRGKKEPSKYHESLAAEAQLSLELAKVWFEDLKDTNPELLITQLEFIDFNNTDFYLKILNETNVDIWTKVFLYTKSKAYLEGLEFLDRYENDLLTDSSDSIYNYYYMKGLMLSGAGMQKEAEEIFLIIKEQKENFRDIQLLLLDTK